MPRTPHPERQVSAVKPLDVAEPRLRDGVCYEDFHAYMPTHQYIFVPTRELWTSKSIDNRLPPKPKVDEDGQQIYKRGEPQWVMASAWLDRERPVEQMTWCPGEDVLVEDRLVSDGGWTPRRGCRCFNLYRPPLPHVGHASEAAPWVEHVKKIYPDDWAHIIAWLAHRVQRPREKINHALVLGGSPGIGKDALLEPVTYAVGPWNFIDVSPKHIMGPFNSFAKSVILRISEARDLGDVDRYAFYEHTKTYIAAPPNVLRVNEKNMREYASFNITGVVMTTNHKTDGLYLPADDRRHYVAWSEASREDIDGDYFAALFAWYGDGGFGHVVAFLSAYDLTEFDPKAPPRHTPAFFDIVASHRAPEDAELATVLDLLAGRGPLADDTAPWPTVVSVADLVERAEDGLAGWLKDRKNSRNIPRRLDTAGYTQVPNPTNKSGLWVHKRARCVLYALKSLNVRDRHIAVQDYLNREH